MRAAECSGNLRIETAFILLVAACLSGCGGGSVAAPPPPAITVTVVGPSAVLNPGSSFTLTATVHNASNSAVTWSIVQAGGGSVTASGVYTAPATPGTYTVKATSQSDPRASGTAPVRVVIPVGHIAGYDVGVDYHAYGSDNLTSDFITIYDQPAVRQIVQAQLQGMADRGATFMNTHLWFADYPGTTSSETYRLFFPMSEQEAANLRAYAQDVAAVVGAGANRLRLDLTFDWIGASDYSMGSLSTGLGYNHDLSPTEFISRTQTTTDNVIAAVSDVMRPDGVRVVDTIYFDAEVTIGNSANNRPNSEWFLTNNYPRFVSVASAHGIHPSVYFSADCPQDVVFDDTWIDPDYAILNGHRTMFWIYRGIQYMLNNGLPLPSSRLDFDCYMTSTGATYDQLLQRILDDADATLPSLGAPRVYGIPETWYFTDPTLRLQYGQAFATQAAQNSRLQRVSFWTTPDGGGPGQDAAFPFTIEDFFPPAP
jgi:hypothetical protein